MKRLAILAALLLTPSLAHAFTVTWNPAATATSYDVERSSDNGTTFAIIGTVTTCPVAPGRCSFTDPTPPAGRPQYRVASKNAGGRTLTITFVGICTNCPTPIPPPPAVDQLDVTR